MSRLGVFRSCCLAVLLLTLGAAQAGGERLFMDSQDTAMKAFESPGQICGPEMRFVLRAATAEAFLPVPTKVEELLGGLRGALSVTCPAAKRIVLSGYVGNELYFAGVSNAQNEWRLTWLAAAPKP
jgi:hypothetical protein